MQTKNLDELKLLLKTLIFLKNDAKSLQDRTALLEGEFRTAGFLQTEPLFETIHKNMAKVQDGFLFLYKGLDERINGKENKL